MKRFALLLAVPLALCACSTTLGGKLYNLSTGQVSPMACGGIYGLAEYSVQNGATTAVGRP